jgi:GT2 family glycosyltransferase
LKLKLKPFRKKKLNIYLDNKLFKKIDSESIKGGKEFELKLDSNLLSKVKKDLIQNAGNFFFRDGSGRDRGVIVYHHKQYYEIDKGQYEEGLIPGFCGAGVLLNRKAVEDVGGFDKRFFMYYEDADLSFRMKERGWEIIYSPDAVIRHIHAGSSEEWSDFFIFHTERGRLIFVAKHWPKSVATGLLLEYIYDQAILTPIYYFLKRKYKLAFDRFKTRLKVIISILGDFVICIIKGSRITREELEKLL